MLSLPWRLRLDQFKKSICPCPRNATSSQRAASRPVGVVASASRSNPCAPPPLRVEDPLFKIPVFVAFASLALYSWYPFKLCSAAGKCLSTEDTSKIAEVLFLLGLFVVAMKMRMWPRKAWTRPPIPVFMVFKFISTTFLLEFGMRCMWRPFERFVYLDIPSLCENTTIHAQAMASQSLFGCDLTSYYLEPLCSVILLPLFSQAVAIASAALFLWSALSAARYLSADQLKGHIVLVVSALTTVALQLYSDNRCSANSEGIYSEGQTGSVGSPFWMQ